MEYLSGFGNHFESEAVKGALPVGQNSPQKVPFGLYAEQLSGTAFTLPRDLNSRTWLYRIRPSVCHEPFKRIDSQKMVRNFGVGNDHLESTECVATPNQLRWSPLEYPSKQVNFVQGMVTICGSGDPCTRNGLAIHEYICNTDMTNTCLYNSDGDFLIVPQDGQLNIKTELGKLQVKPGEIIVIPVLIVNSVAFGLASIWKTQKPEVIFWKFMTDISNFQIWAP